MNDIVDRLRNYALAEDLHDIERKDLLKAAVEIESLRNDPQDKNGLINRLKHELQSIEYALSDVRINNTMTAADVAHEMRCELDALREQEPITAVQDDYSADGRSQRIYDYLPAGTQLYAAPTPPSAPERITPDGMYGKQHMYAEGWNDCIDVMTPKPGERS